MNRKITPTPLNWINVFILSCLLITYGSAFSQNNCLPAECDFVELAENGDFSNGRTGFTTNLSFSMRCQVGSYAVEPNAQNKCGFWDPIFDNTTGNQTGNFLLVDGPQSAAFGNLIWRQSINVNANYRYYFSFWLFPSLSRTSGTIFLDVIINNQVVDQISADYANNRNWTQYCSEWVSNTTGNVFIEIRQVRSFGEIGFDYGIDDISFGTCCAVTADASAAPSSICIGNSSQLNVQTSAGSPSFQWSPILGLDCTTCQDPEATPINNTTYTVTVTDNHGCTASDDVTVTVVPDATLTIVAFNPDICIGESANLQAFYTPANATINWTSSSGDNTELSCLNCSDPTVTPSSVGQTTYKAIITTPEGCTKEDEVTINVYGPQVTASVTVDEFCFGESTQLNATYSPSNASINWTSSTGNSDELSCTNCLNPTATPSTVGNTTYTVTITDNGCTATSEVTVTTLQPEVAITQDDTEICKDASIQLSSIQLLYPYPTDIDWSPASSLSCTKCDDPVAKPSSTTTYTITITDTQFGCRASDNVTITVLDPEITIDQDDEEICIEESVQLTTSQGLYPYPTSINWHPSSTLSCATCPDPVATPTTTTTYTVTITDPENGCVDSDEITISVLDPQVEIVAAKEEICINESTQLTALSSFSNYPTTLSWSPSNTLSCNNCFNPLATPTQTTTYTVTMNENGCTATDEVRITVLDPQVTASADTYALCEGECVTLHATEGPSIHPTSVSWVSSTGEIREFQDCTTCKDPTVCPPYEAGKSITTSYTVTINENGCENTDKVDIVVHYPDVSATASPKVICDGESSTISASGADTYHWDNNVGAGATHTVSPNTNTTYTVTGTTGHCTDEDDVSISVAPNPVVSISPSAANICDDESVLLTASGATSYLWNDGVTGASRYVSPNTTTTYTVTGTSGPNCTGEASVTVTVRATPAVAITPQNPEICPGESITLTATGSSTYQWYYFDNGWKPGPATEMYTVSPTYSVNQYRVIGTASNSCNTAAYVQVTINPRSYINIFPQYPSVCPGDPVTLDASCSGCGSYSYSWENGPNTPTYTVSPTEETTYTVTYTNDYGCTNSSSRTVKMRPVPDVSIAPDEPEVCPGEHITLTANGALNYTWSGGAGTVGGSGNSQYTVSPSANTTYVVEGTNNYGCKNSASKEVMVKPLPDITVNPDQVTICDGESATLTASGGVSYQWTGGPNSASYTVSPPSFGTYPSVNTYTVTGMGNNGCSNTAQGFVITHPNPVISIAPANPVVCAGKSITLTASGAMSYQWTGGPNTASFQVFPETNASYTVTGTDANGCTATASISVTVLPNPDFVHNKDFETGTTPTDRDQVNRATEWFAATGTPDLYDRNFGACNPGPCGVSLLDMGCVGIPCNHFGNEPSRLFSAGNRYAGLWFAVGTEGSIPSLSHPLLQPYIPNISTTAGSSELLDLVVEGIEVPIDQLDPTKTYTMSFFVSKAEKGELENLVVDDEAHFIVKMSERAATSPDITVGPVSIPRYDPVEANVIYQGKTSLTNGWEEIRFDFQPEKGFEFLIIESAYDLNILDRVAATGVSFSWTPPGLPAPSVTYDGIESYMYIDDISIKEKCNTPFVVNIGGGLEGSCQNPVPCNTFNLFTISHPTIGGTPPYSYSWSPATGLSNPNVLRPYACPEETTTYTLTVTDANGNTGTAQVLFYVSDLTADAGPDHRICANEVVSITGQYTGGLAPVSYGWSPAGYNGCATNCLTTQVKGASPGQDLYTFTVSDAFGCMVSDDVLVSGVLSSLEDQVTNGGFESGVIPEGRDEFSTDVSHWTATSGNPDVMDSRVNCPAANDPNCVDIPANHFGNQQHWSQPGPARRYGGLWAAIGEVVNPQKYVNETVRLVEGIQSRLAAPLEAGEVYELRFIVSLAEKGETNGIANGGPATYVVKLSNGAKNSPGYAPVEGDVVHTASTSQSNGWEQVSVFFKVTQNGYYDHIIIESDIDGDITGKPTSVLPYLTFPPSSITIPSGVIEEESYMYIDNVSIKLQCSPPTSFVVVSPSSGSMVANNSLDRAEQGQQEQLNLLNGGMSEKDLASLGQQELVWNIYPNPARDYFTIDGIQPENSLVIYNLLGERVAVPPVNVSDNKMNVYTADWPTGVYIVEIKDANNPVFRQRVSVVR